MAKRARAQVFVDESGEEIGYGTQADGCWLFGTSNGEVGLSDLRSDIIELPADEYLEASSVESQFVDIGGWTYAEIGGDALLIAPDGVTIVRCADLDPTECDCAEKGEVCIELCSSDPDAVAVAGDMIVEAVMETDTLVEVPYEVGEDENIEDESLRGAAA